MRSNLASIGPPQIVAGLIVLALNAYALMGGADFGGGLWDLLAAGPRRNDQRKLIETAIGPIWEANHVWLIVVIVMLFTAFPAAYAMLGTVLHVPLALLLVGIVLRGSAFAFRRYGNHADAGERAWGRAFAVASTITPILLGTIIGALSTESVGMAATDVAGGSFTAIYVAPWFAAFPLAVGVMALALFALVAAVYLTVEARDEGLREDFRRRGLAAAIAVCISAFGALAIAHTERLRIGAGLTTAPWSLTLHVATAAAAVIVIGALWTRRYSLARLAVIVQLSLILWGWAIAQYPWLIPQSLTIDAAAAPRITLELLLIGLAGGALILVPSLLYLFRVFAPERVRTVGEGTARH